MSKMREEFDAWWKCNGMLDASPDEVEMAFYIWKSSRATLCVNVGRAYQQGGMMADYLVEAALDEVGVSYV